MVSWSVAAKARVFRTCVLDSVAEVILKSKCAPSINAEKEILSADAP
jgi:hypothetical protein